MTLKEIKKILKERNIRPSRRLGQNFLISEAILRKIIQTADLSKDDIILEIGPGIGSLTLELAKKAKRIVAIEKDSKMCEILKDTTKSFANITVIQKDILKIKDYELFKILKIKNSYKIIANLPYYITSPSIRKFLENENPPKEMILMVQKEVAQRIYAKPPDMNILAVSVQFYASPEVVSYVSKKAFWPEPKVDSAIIRIAKINSDKKIDIQKFFKIVKAGFSQPRKQLVNNLSHMLKYNKKEIETYLLKNNIQPIQRAETLSLEDWLNLAKSFKWKKKNQKKR